MNQINLYFTILLLSLNLTGKPVNSGNHYSQINTFFKTTESRSHNNPEFVNDGSPDDKIGIATRWNFDQDGRPEPGHRKGGASRGNCPPIQPALTALIPKNNLGLTTQEYPTFWFYIPYNSTDIPIAELMLLDENQDLMLEKPIMLQLSATPGIIGVTLPS